VNKSQANRAIIAKRAGKSSPNYALLTTGPLGCNVAARVERTAPRPGFVSRKNKAPKITAGQQKHWNRPAHLTGTLAAVANDRRWSA
jgi:hypothetical protein